MNSFDPNAWSLLYFTGGAGLPLTPDELFDNPAQLCRVVVMNNTPEDWVSLPSANVRQLYETLDDALTHRIVTSAGRMFTIHKLSLLERLLRWKEMSRREASQQRAPMMPAVTDLVEAFHSPAILSYPQRKEFSATQVAKWLSGHTTGDTIINFEREREAFRKLCQLL